MNLGATGVFCFTDGMTAERAAEFAQRLEELEYSALWIPEALGRHSFANAAWLLARTQRLIVATGIANIYARDAMATASAQKTLAEQSGGRFLLGLGVSHAPFVEGLRGHAYGKPVATMRAYLEAMEKAPYTSTPPAEKPPTVIAPLGHRMRTDWTLSRPPRPTTCGTGSVHSNFWRSAPARTSTLEPMP